MTNDYRYINPKKFADKIANFCLVIKMPVKIAQELITNDQIYLFLYLSWQKSNQTDSCPIKKIFLDKILNSVSLKEIPKISCNNCNIIPGGKDCVANIMSHPSMLLSNLHEENIPSIYSSPPYIYPDNTNYQTVKYLGAGSYGSVYHVKLLNNDIALKKMSSSNKNDGIRGYMLREINTLNFLDHPNIIKMLGFMYDYKNIDVSIGLELMETTLENKINKYNLDEKTKAQFIIQLLCGLEHMHKKKFMHRDLSTKNILISSNGTLKIGDLGSSKYFRHQKYIVKYNANVCSIYFRAIELFLGKSRYTSAIDIWSCACVIGFILCGTYLFVGKNEHDFICNIFSILGIPNENYYQEYYYQDSWTWPYIKLNDPQYQRKGFIKLEQKYPEQSKILYKMLEYDPEKRITATKALELFSVSYKKLLN